MVKVQAGASQSRGELVSREGRSSSWGSAPMGRKAAQLCLNVLQLHARSLRLLREFLSQSSRGGNAMSQLSRQLFTHECRIVKLWNDPIAVGLVCRMALLAAGHARDIDSQRECQCLCGVN